MPAGPCIIIITFVFIILVNFEMQYVRKTEIEI